MAEAPRIEKDKVRSMLDDPDVVIIDVRGFDQWQDSNKKIIGANFEDRDNIESWANKYDKNRTLVLYCA